jgi:hypothetical protein
VAQQNSDAKNSKKNQKILGSLLSPGNLKIRRVIASRTCFTCGALQVTTFLFSTFSGHNFFYSQLSQVTTFLFSTFSTGVVRNTLGALDLDPWKSLGLPLIPTMMDYYAIVLGPGTPIEGFLVSTNCILSQRYLTQ